ERPIRRAGMCCISVVTHEGGRELHEADRAYHRLMQSQIDLARNTAAALDYLREHDSEHLKQLDEFLSLESVSADPERNDDVRRTAQWVADELSRLGVE